ncbi:PIG-L family deacetylase [Streptomyces sp. NPDC101132]|uniref:PIG-L family deacetylase n=1 Tax=Streptomyces sp. NPDC101132 TaxID=3366110 RepID=UPI0037FEE792
MPPTHRRRTPPRTMRKGTLALLAALCVAAAGTVAYEAAPGGTGTAAAGDDTAAGTNAGRGSVLQVVAHPDDDLYFMNPDLSQSMAAGHPLTTVYLTSGESDGVNAAGGRGAPRPAADRAAYAEARQNGIRAAYAQMATGDRTSRWTRSAVATRGGGHAELDVLDAAPSVRLVWLQMREARVVSADQPHSLHGLWDGRVPRLESQLTSGTPVRTPFSYDREQVVRTLTGLLETYHPTLVRTQDPTPGRYRATRKPTDHQDHVYGARFVQAALTRYAAEDRHRPHFTVQNYLGYQNSSFATALDPDNARRKLAVLDAYAWLGGQDCGSPAGCGDLKVSRNPGGNHWSQDIRYARGTGTSWLVPAPGGRLSAFSVLDGQLAVWERRGPAAPWTGPALVPGTGMDQGVSALRLPDGRIAVTGTRTEPGARGTDYRREVVLAVQRTPGGTFGPWQSLGTPERDDATWLSDLGAPALAADGTGRLAVYVRDGAQTLRGRTQRADGGWGPWDRLGGTDLHGNPAAATDARGRRYVFSSTGRSVLGWAQRSAGAPLGPATATGLPPTTIPLTAVPDGAGVRLWFRKPGSGDLRTALAGQTPGLKVSPFTETGGLGGYGGIAAAGRVLAARSADGGLGTGGGPGTAWEHARVMFDGAPAAARTDDGRTTLAVVGIDGRLYWSATDGSPDAPLSPWAPAGPAAG